MLLIFVWVNKFSFSFFCLCLLICFCVSCSFFLFPLSGKVMIHYAEALLPFEYSFKAHKFIHPCICFATKAIHSVEIEGLRALVGVASVEVRHCCYGTGCENFRALCTGEKGKSASGVKLHHTGTPFHWIISGFVIQGRDIVHHDGRASESFYGGTFPD